MAEITKELGRVPISRGEFNLATTYYKDNIVQYKRGSYQVISESPIIGVLPTNDKNVVNPGWTLFAGTLDAQDVFNQIKEQEAQSIQAVAAREQEILTKTDASLVSSNTEGLEGSNVQANLNDASNKLSELDRIVNEHFNDIETRIPQDLDNEEFIQVLLDMKNKIIKCIHPDGSFTFYTRLSLKDGISINENEITTLNTQEYIEVKVDSKNKILYAIKPDGTTYIPKLESPTLDATIEYLQKKIAENVFAIEMDNETGDLIAITGEDSNIIDAGMTEDGDIWADWNI